MAINPEVFNRQFLNKVKDDGLREKVAESTAYVVRDKLREEGFMEKILPAPTAKSTELYRRKDKDEVYMLVDIEPGSSAITMTFRGEPKAQYITTPRAELNFFKLATPKYAKTEDELMAIPYTVTDLLKKYAVPDIQALEDLHFLQYSYLAANHAGNVLIAKDVNGDTITGDTSITLTKDNLSYLLKQFAHTERRASKILMSEETFLDTLTWTLQDFGDKVYDVTVGGFNSTTLLGYQVIRSIKSPMLPYGMVYAYTDPEFLGVGRKLYDIKLGIRNVYDKLEFMLWKSIGAVIVSDKSVAVLSDVVSSGAIPSASIPTNLSDEDVQKYYYNKEGVTPSIS